MLGKHGTSSIKCSDKPQTAREAVRDKACHIGNTTTMSSKGEGAEDDTPQHSCVSPMADTSCDWKMASRKLLIMTLIVKKSLKLEHGIQNVITAYKQLYEKKCHKLNNREWHNFSSQWPLVTLTRCLLPQLWCQQFSGCNFQSHGKVQPWVRELFWSGVLCCSLLFYYQYNRSLCNS